MILSLFLLISSNFASAQTPFSPSTDLLPEYRTHLKQPLADPREISATYGLENEFSCQWVNAAVFCMSAAAFKLHAFAGTLTFFLSTYSVNQSKIAGYLLQKSFNRYLSQHPEVRAKIVEEYKKGPFDNDNGSQRFKIVFGDTRLELYFKQDPGVLEVSNSPFTLQEYQSGIAEQIDAATFQAGKKVLVHPALFFASGHLNIGIQNTFGNPDRTINLLALRNFLVDFLNHSELYYGAFLYNPLPTSGAPPLPDQQDRAKFAMKLRSFDQALRDGVATLAELEEMLALFDMTRKDHAISIHRGLVELRSVRAQRNLTQLNLLLELIQARIETLARVQEPIPFLDVGAIRSHGQGLAQFTDYVVGSGKSMETYRELLPRYWRLFKPDWEFAFKTNPRHLSPWMTCQLLFMNR